MKYLLDTHTLLWFVEGNTNLSRIAQNLLNNQDNTKFLSVVSLWEIVIKVSIGKLKLNENAETFIAQIMQSDIEILAITEAHLAKVLQLDFHHKAPFDRMIISQALVENMDIMSKDEKFDAYFVNQNVQKIW